MNELQRQAHTLLTQLNLLQGTTSRLLAAATTDATQAIMSTDEIVALRTAHQRLIKQYQALQDETNEEIALLQDENRQLLRVVTCMKERMEAESRAETPPTKLLECRVPWCTEPVNARDLCIKHYYNLRTHGHWQYSRVQGDHDSLRVEIGVDEYVYYKRIKEVP